MAGSHKLKGTKCYDACGSDGNIDLISCVDHTTDECALGKRETGSQNVDVKNAKRHAVDVEIEMESQNGAVEYTTGSGTTDPHHDEDLTVGPASIGNAGTISFDIEIRQTSQTLLTKETLEVSLDYEYHNSSRGTRSGPRVYPRIDLK